MRADLANMAATNPAAVALVSEVFQLIQSAPGYNASNLLSGSCGDGGCDRNPAFTQDNCFAPVSGDAGVARHRMDSERPG